MRVYISKQGKLSLSSCAGGRYAWYKLFNLAKSYNKNLGAADVQMMASRRGPARCRCTHAVVGMQLNVENVLHKSLVWTLCAGAGASGTRRFDSMAITALVVVLYFFPSKCLCSAVSAIAPLHCSQSRTLLRKQCSHSNCSLMTSSHVCRLQTELAAGQGHIQALLLQ